MSASLYADEYAYVGQDYLVHISGIPSDAFNMSVRVSTPRGENALYREYPEQSTPPFEVLEFRIPVTRAWGWGHVYVEWQYENATGPYTEQRMAEVVCPAACVAQIVRESAEEAMRPLIGMEVAFLILAMLFVGHAAHVYRVQRGGNDLSWYERVVALTSPIQRIQNRADVLNKHQLPPRLQKRMDEISRGLDRLRELQQAEKQMNHLHRVIGSRIRKAVKKDG